ncbi:adhesion G protein-coupled receptor L4-like [Rhopilema esculentum]|uniref:adhesion G protein-coupled receptor L4-like n=1 Tax=Rhopilema esculentum TaxID=499914 RepID=UPI0031CEBB90
MKTLPAAILSIIVLLTFVNNEKTAGQSNIVSTVSLSDVNISSIYSLDYSPFNVAMTTNIQHSSSTSEFATVFPSIRPTRSSKENASSHYSVTVTTIASNTSSEDVSDSLYLVYQKFSRIDSYVRLVDLCFAVLSYLVLVLLRLPKSSKFFIHKNLVAAIGINDLITGVISNENIIKYFSKNQHTCAMLLVLYYYWQLALFSWMAVEAFNICLMLSEVFDTRSKLYKHLCYLAFGYGSPALIVIFVVSFVWKKEFTNMSNCVSFIDPWTFRGPAAAYISINILGFIYILGFSFRHIITSNKYKGGFRKFIGTIRSFLVLYPILGISQVSGFFLQNNIVVFGWLYIVTTGFLAVLFFIFHELLDAQVMGALKLKFCGNDRSQSNRSSNSRMTMVYNRSLKKISAAEVDGKDVIENKGVNMSSKL